MKQLSAQTVTVTHQQMRQLDSNDLQKLGINFLKQQPEAYHFLLRKGDQPRFNQEEREFLLYQGMVLWQMIRKSFPKDSHLRKLQAMEFEEYEMVNEMLLGELEDLAWEDALLRLKELAATHVQPEIMRHVLEVVDKDPNEAAVSSDNKLLLVRYLSTLLDALCEQET